MGRAPFPIRHKLTRAYRLSIVTTLVMVVVSLAGLLDSLRLYPTEALRSTLIPNDILNIVIGMPILLVSMWLTQRGRIVGLLFWPGALLYVVYNYTAYLFAVPLGVITFFYLLLVSQSAYIIYDLRNSIDMDEVRDRLIGKAPEKLTGWFLIVFGGLFAFRAIGMIAQANIEETTLQNADIGVLIADLVLTICWIAGGVLLLRKQPLGYVGGLGLLFSASMLFVGLIGFLLLQPLMTDAPFAPLDVIVVFFMGFICFIPFLLYLRAVRSVG